MDLNKRKSFGPWSDQSSNPQATPSATQKSNTQPDNELVVSQTSAWTDPSPSESYRDLLWLLVMLQFCCGVFAGELGPAGQIVGMNKDQGKLQVR